MKRQRTICVALIFVIGIVCTVQAAEKPAGTSPKDEWISEDKLLHVVTSAFFVGFSYRAYHGEFDNPAGDSRVFAVSVTAFAGIGKELYDMSSPNQTASWKDIAADAVGIALGLVLFTYLD
jgi:uncharacterized protein YfiM (DUF2279 family)